MRKYLYPGTLFILFSMTFVALPAYYYQSETMQRAAQGTRDAFFKIRHATTAAPNYLQNIVIVPIDEESSSRLEARWPWSRKTFAKIINQLKNADARVVGLNLSFSGLESGDETATEALAQSLSAYGKAVIGSTFDEDGRPIEPSLTLKKASAGVGYLEKIIDPDLSIRRSYLLRPYQSEGGSRSLYSFAPSFPLEVLRVHNKLNRKDLYFENETGFLKIKGSSGWWLNPDGSYMINYLAKERDFKRISAWKIAAGKFTPSDVENKIVLIGLGSSLFADMHPTPFGLMPGIVIHANEFLSMMSERPLRFVKDTFVFVMAWFVGLLVLSLYLLKRFWIGLAASFVAFFGLFLGAEITFARDFLIEPFILLLGPFFATLYGILFNSFRLLIENRGLETKVIHDKMTGLYKYEYLRECLEEEWKRCKKGKFPVSIAMTDLDRFKKINDTLGHEVGNEMIIRAGNVIKDSARRYDVVSRYGGDEFVILLWHATLDEAKAYRNRLRDSYHAMASKLQPELQDSSISIGVACFDPAANPNYPPDPQRLVEDADKDLFLDKESRRKGPSR